MRRFAAPLALLLAMSVASPAAARGYSNFLSGFNAILTAPADPVMTVVEPPETLTRLPGGQVTGRVVGVFSGTLQMAYRATMGVLDIAFAPFWIFPHLAPQPRYKLIPGWEWEGY